MKIAVNLATRPFVELRPLFARLRLAMLLLVALAVALGFALHVLDAKAAVAGAKMNALKAKTTEFQHERQMNEARMHQPENMAVLERSRFLNTLFAEKSFSWTAVMMDLERVLPMGVQVTSIDPVMTKEGDVNIRLRVSGDREKAVQLVRNLETSQRFVSPRLSGETAMTQAEASRGGPMAAPGGVVFEILSGYNPLPETTASSDKASQKSSSGKPSQKSSSSRSAQKKSGGTR
ncbi:hypothetical protein GCM10011507_17130 [Edaphobacter acidisoli]|uniref:Fimbrial assembly protein n=1 Tax=Edaphobacter acidisoli TaxID=2040573 RepID=A0A916RRM9_9BACT|nr:fimbrial assembly protein [Edaphobacter acidisoli]GGA66119.1 hypothetical protein GCM10011507_17130 [Edaphobacter acidisoli]